MSVSPRPEVERLGSYLAGRSARDVKRSSVIKLSSNEAAFPPLPSVLAAATDALSEMQRYPDMHATRLSAELAIHHAVEPDWVAVTGGSSALIRHLSESFVGPGDEVLFGSPTFDVYATSARITGGVPVSVPLRDGHLVFDDLKAAVTPRTKLVYICSPNNPTGTVVSHIDLRDFTSSLPSTTLVAIDEAYSHFVTDAQAANGPALAREFENVAVLRSFSKAYGLAGLRIGYCLARPEVLAPLRKVITPFSASSVAQTAATVSLTEAAQAELMRRAEQTVCERSRVTARLRELGWHVPDSEANFVWFGIEDKAADFTAACEGAGFLVRIIDSAGVRVTIGTPEENDAFLASPPVARGTV